MFVFQSVSGTLEFQPGERYKYISVNITDNSVPELEKSFKVELLNLEGGGKLVTQKCHIFACPFTLMIVDSIKEMQFFESM